MKILEIVPQLNSGGAERFVVDLCNELVSKHTVYLIVLHSFDKFGFYMNELNPNVSVINMHKRQGMDFNLFVRLNKVISTIAPDVVHTHLSAIIYASYASFIHRKSTVFLHTVHNDAVKEAERGLSKWMRKFVFQAKLIVPVTISEESQKSFSDFYHLPSNLICNGRPAYIMPDDTKINSIRQELHELKVHKDAITILNVARIQPQKNQVELVRAIQSLNQQGIKIELFHIGSVADNVMASDIGKLNSPYVHILGKRENTRDYMVVADAFCLSSIFEGMPITLIECFSVGTIPICTPVGGIKNMIIDGQNGLLADGCSCHDLENVLLRFVHLDEKQKCDIKRKSELSFMNFSIQTSTAKYVDLMKKLVYKK